MKKTIHIYLHPTATGAGCPPSTTHALPSHRQLMTPRRTLSEGSANA